MSVEIATSGYVNSSVMAPFTPVDPFPDPYCPAAAELREKAWLSGGDIVRVGVDNTQPWECVTRANVSRAIIPYGGTAFTIDRGAKNEFLTAHSGIIDKITISRIVLNGIPLSVNVSATRPGVASVGLISLHLENDSSFRITMSDTAPATATWTIEVRYNLQTTIYTIITR